ncbi:MAG TPA: peptide ABC transporter substrate-binding protein [Candidatus Paceibacterota bacterium]|nr:peptide ABC transporter substrate-binding protein [Candidatus Paceibacterota bacterium]
MNTIFKKLFYAFSRAERIAFITAVVFALLSSVALGSIFVKEKTVVVPAAGGSYTEGILGQPAYINPVTASTEADKSLVRLIFSNLADVSDKIAVDKTGKNWDIRLKEGIRWSDGEKLTSDDVIFTIQKIQDPDSNSPLFSGWQGVGVSRVSELELQITLGTPYSFFEQNLKDLYILPKHLFAEAAVGNWNLSKYNLQPVGSGPYSFDSYEVRDDGFITAYHLKPNKTYFASQPLISEFSFKFFKNAPDLISSFNSGQIDGFAVDSGQANGINRPYEEHNFFLSSYYAVFFNQGQNIALQDKNVRQALSIAVDRKTLVDEVLNGNGEERFGPVSPSLLQNGQNQQDTFSVDAANKILDDAGWTMGDSGVRQKSIRGTEIPLEFGMVVPQIPFLQKTADDLQNYWSAIGAKVDITVLSPEEISADTMQNRNYESILFGNMLNPAGDLFAFWHSSQRFYPGLNLSLYNNKKADSLITSINQSTDSLQMASDTQSLNDMISGDYPAVFLYSPYYSYFSRKDLQGVQAGLINEQADRLDNVDGWYLKTARSLK